jgi:lipopolysaccharide transport system ATP-binding protein
MRSIEIQSLSKRYRLGRAQHEQMLRERLAAMIRRPFGRSSAAESVWALRDVSFDADEGEVIGIIGRNGAGKSTLLKILSRITHPTSGSARVNGRVAALLEVGTGFHDELTGRENIYLNGSILGMRKREVEDRFDAIVDFSGVEQFIDTPIKHYSSGMRLRLGFAVAAHLEPDVLIVDEVLAVGDAGFQKKCISTMEGLRRNGRTVLFVSHNLAAVENLCSRGIWIDAGTVKMDADAKQVIAAYMESFLGERPSGSDLTTIESRLGTGEIRFTRLEFLSPDGTACAMIRSGDSVVFRFHFRASVAIRDPSFGFRLFSQMGTLITESGNWHHGIHIPKVEPGSGHIDVEIESLNLIAGQYSLSLWITGTSDKHVYDGDVRTSLDIEAADVYRSGRMLNSSHGITYFPQRWTAPEATAGLRGVDMQPAYQSRK